MQPHIYKTWLKAPVQFLETESGDGSDTQSDTSKKMVHRILDKTF